MHQDNARLVWNLFSDRWIWFDSVNFVNRLLHGFDRNGSNWVVIRLNVGFFKRFEIDRYWQLRWVMKNKMPVENKREIGKAARSAAAGNRQEWSKKKMKTSRNVKQRNRAWNGRSLEKAFDILKDPIVCSDYSPLLFPSLFLFFFPVKVKS